MRTFAKNFKSLVFPKCFLPLTFRKTGAMIAYVILVMLIAVTLFKALPLFLGDDVSEMMETAEKELPDFYYEDGYFSFNDDEEFLWENDQNMIYICTAVDSFGSQTADYLEGNLTGLPAQAIWVSSTDILSIQYGEVTRMTMEEFMSVFGVTTLDKAQFLDILSALMNVILVIGTVFSFIGSVIGIFFYSLIWGFIAFLINLFQNVKYAYGRMYRLAVYVLVPMRVLRMLCTSFLPLPGQIISLVFTGLILLYLFLALFMDENQKKLLEDRSQA